MNKLDRRKDLMAFFLSFAPAEAVEPEAASAGDHDELENTASEPESVAISDTSGDEQTRGPTSNRQTKPNEALKQR